MLALWENLEAGNVIVHSSEDQIWVWKPGNCVVRVLTGQGEELDVWSFATMPATINEAVDYCKNKVAATSGEENE